jgi:hypothetical protein
MAGIPGVVCMKVISYATFGFLLSIFLDIFLFLERPEGLSKKLQN